MGWNTTLGCIYVKDLLGNMWLRESGNFDGRPPLAECLHRLIYETQNLGLG